MARSKRRSRGEDKGRWLTAPKGEVHDRACERVLAIVRSQYEFYDRLIKLAALYDPNGWASMSSQVAIDRRIAYGQREGTQVIDNVIASNVDSTAGSLCSPDVRPAFPSDGANWSTQRTLRHLEFYAEDLRKFLELHPKEERAGHEAGLKGTGVCKVVINAYREVEATHPLLDDIIVDEGSLQPDGWPMEMFERLRIDRDELAAQYPEYRQEIQDAAAGSTVITASSTWFSRWMNDGRLQRNQLGVLEGYYRPIGRKGKPGYIPGRHFKAIDGCTILDEPWEEEYFPYARFLWTERYGCWYGIGGAERITGHQRRLNKHNWQFDAQLDNIARPTTFLRPADANIAVMDRTPLGTLAICRGEWPKTIIPTAVSPEQYQRDEVLHARSFENFGQSRMAATGMKPPGIDSGVALREYKDQHSDRFASQEEGYEAFKLKCTWLALMCCKKLGREAPVFYRKTTYGVQKLEWSKVDPKETRVRIKAASTLSQTVAGKKQFAMELAQGGVISTDEMRRILDFPDIERTMSLYNAALENIERALEDMLDGHFVSPHEFMSLKMCVWRGQAQLNLAEMADAPEHVLENLRQFTLTAAWMVQRASAPEAGAAQMAGGAAGVLPGAQPAPGDVPPEAMLQGGPPTGPPPEAALSPQAMQLVAG